MKNLAACFVVCFLLANAGEAFGQSQPFSPTFTEPDTTAAQPLVRRRLGTKSSAAQLLQERAMRQAKEREARIQARKWRGISLMRPTYPGFYTVLQDWYRVNGPAWRGRGDWNYFRIR
ncbi:MAG: hypothetical protein Tsb009_31010 [Planctomycetaceae bacterium]